MSKFENSIKDDKPKKSYSSKDAENDINKEKITNPITNNSEKFIHDRDRTEQKTANIIFNDNEAQFLMLANKFNEAVEVILELSNKVEKLEKILDQSSSQTKYFKKKFSFFNLKIFIFILIIPLSIIGFFTLPVDFSLLNLILVDVFSIF
tara:strand:- start:104 stop:553 length:450 start_codon:yes stop_codon:yes gene_type:complete